MNDLPSLPLRAADSHKGDYGRLLVVGGSRGMAGAVALCGMAALRSGAGLVTLAVPASVQNVAAGFDPCLMTTPLPEHDDRPGQICAPARTDIVRLADRCQAVAFGPGAGRSEGLDLLAAWLYEHLPQPLVIDADGLNGLAQRKAGLADPGGARILTPHPGEFRRLLGREPHDREEAEAEACRLAAEHNVVIVLKGHRTFITDGRARHHNATGNPGMATAGSGDVLTGLIAALVGQGIAPLDAARLGAHLHGLAGDLAAAELGQVGMVASDLLRFLPLAFMQHQRGD
ncbi:MAG: NAD(P)H-hydrate dehydratase [Planctomycetales bacterium]|nr:NAD(P)H-hydrate dehydratase [Planctomycetales bacterium]